MDKLEIKQSSFIQQTQYFIPVEIDLSVVPAHSGKTPDQNSFIISFIVPPYEVQGH
jgi:hypothetical protein